MIKSLTSNSPYTFLFVYFSVLHSVFSQIDILDNSVNAFYYEDSQYLWVSSEKGWHKYDGINTETYAINDSISGLKGTWIQSSLFPDNQGRLWTCTYEYLCWYDSHIDRFFCIQPDIGGDTLKSNYKLIGVDHSSQELFYRAGDGLFALNLATSSSKSIANTQTKGIVFDPIGYSEAGRLEEVIASPWIIDHELEHWRRTASGWNKTILDFTKCQSPLNQISISNVLSYQGQLFLASNIGLMVLDVTHPCNSQVLKFSQDIHINDIIIRDSKLYISTQLQGLWMYDLDKEEVTKHYTVSTKELALDFNSPTQLFAGEDALYLSYRNQPIQVIPYYQLDNAYTIEQSISSNIEKILCIDTLVFLQVGKAEICVIGTQGEIVDKITLADGQVINDLQIIDEELYFRDYFNLYQYDVASKMTKLLVKDKSKQLHKLIEYDGGIGVVANANFYRYDSTSSAYSLALYKGLSGSIYDVSQLDTNTIAIFSGSSDLHIITKDDTLYYDVQAYALSHIYDSSQQRLYIGSNNGLQYIDLKSRHRKIINHWRIQQLPIEELHLMEDNILMLSDHNAYVLHKNDGRLYQLNYGSDDPGKNTAFDQKKIYWSEENRLYAKSIDEAIDGTVNEVGINVATYEQTMSDSIITVKYGWKDTPPVFQFGYNTKSSNEVGKYRYSIDQQAFSLADISLPLQVPVLAEGEHSIVVQGLNSSLVKSNQLRISLKVVGPIWRQWWFYLCILVGILGITYAYFNAKTRRLVQLHRMKEEINDLEKSALQAQMNPHFIFNCLNSIQSYIAQNERVLAMDYLGKFAKLIRQYLNASVHGVILLEEEIAMLTAYCDLETLRFTDRFDYKIMCNVDVDPSQIYIPAMLIQPFVENAILHGMRGNSNGLIQVKFAIEDQSLKVTVSDNGGGFNQSKLNKRSLGMSITKQRLNHIQLNPNKEYEISINTSDQGSIIEFNIPISH